MKKILQFVLLATLSFPLISEEIAPFYQFSIFGKEHFSTIGIMFDYPLENENSDFYLSEQFGFSFNENYPAGIDVEFHIGKKIINRKLINKLGLCGGIVSLVKAPDSMCILNMDFLYRLILRLDDKSYLPVYAGLEVKGGCGYSITSTEKSFIPCLSASLSIGLLL